MLGGPKNKFGYHQLLVSLAYLNLRLVTTPANANANRIVAEIAFKTVTDGKLMTL
jgi:hypothetical protein